MYGRSGYCLALLLAAAGSSSRAMADEQAYRETVMFDDGVGAVVDFDFDPLTYQIGSVSGNFSDLSGTLPVDPLNAALVNPLNSLGRDYFGYYEEVFNNSLEQSAAASLQVNFALLDGRLVVATGEPTQYWGSGYFQGSVQSELLQLLNQPEGVTSEPGTVLLMLAGGMLGWSRELCRWVCAA